MAKYICNFKNPMSQAASGPGSKQVIRKGDAFECTDKAYIEMLNARYEGADDKPAILEARTAKVAPKANTEANKGS